MEDISESVYPINTFATANDILCIFCGEADTDQMHCGILFKYNGNPNVLHLRYHRKLVSHSLNDKSMKDVKYVMVKSKISTDMQIVISAKCRRIIKTNQQIPYGLSFENSTFNKDGKLILGVNEVGLTCATFVLSVFNSCNINLIDLKSWPCRPEDKIWHNQIISKMIANKELIGITDAEIMKIVTETGCARFRPEEVTISSIFNPNPAHFETISQYGIKLKQKIQSL